LEEDLVEALEEEVLGEEVLVEEDLVEALEEEVLEEDMVEALEEEVLEWVSGEKRIKDEFDETVGLDKIQFMRFD
jgi:hypothetical protein